MHIVEKVLAPGIPLSVVRPILAGFVGGLAFLLAMPPSGVYVLALVCFVPLLYILREDKIVSSVIAGSMVSLVGFISIPIAVISRGPEVFAGSILLTSLALGLPTLIGAILTRAVGGKYACIVFPPAFVIGQFILERGLSIPISVAILFPVESLNGSRLFSVIGGHGVDVVIVTINVLIFQILTSSRRTVPALSAGTLFMLGTAMVLLPTPDIPNARSMSVTAIDPSIFSRSAIEATRDPEKMLAVSHLFDDLTQRAIDQGTELVVWPESGNGLANAQLPHRRAAIADMQKGNATAVLATGIHFSEAGKQFNSAHLFEHGKVVTTLTKQSLVPIVEDQFLQGQLAPISVGNIGALGIGICFDSAFPGVMGDLVRNGAEALLIVSNDASFGISGLSALHIRYSALKALEQQRELLFVSNTGPVIQLSNLGRVINGYWSSDEPRTSTYRIKLNSKTTPYNAFPRVFQLLTIALCLLLIGMAFIRGAR